MSRLIWQFNLTGQQWMPDGPYNKDDHKWEVRYFWPIDEVIHLNLSNDQLNWQQGVCKTHRDIYWIDNSNPSNIKERKSQLVHKALVAQYKHRTAYAKKAPLVIDTCHHSQYEQVLIEKHALQLTLFVSPKCVLELSKITLRNQHFSSLCLESRSSKMIDTLHQHLQLPGKAMSYVDFLTNFLANSVPAGKDGQ